MAAVFGHAKAKAWVKGRSETWGKLASFRNLYPEKPLIWMHCASSGEFEQGRPVLEALAAKMPDHLKVLTFYSPSGYEQKQHYAGADLIVYLPADEPGVAEQWYAELRPSLSIFVKYEFWYGYLAEGQKSGTKLALIAGAFGAKHFLFGPLGRWLRLWLGFFDVLCVQDESSKNRLEEHGIMGAKVTGDPRASRVWQIKNASGVIENERLKSFSEGHKVLVCGSTWPADEQILSIFWKHYLCDAGWKLLIVPHEISEEGLRRTEQLFEGNAIRYTKSESTPLAHHKILVLDTFGMLSRAYAYGRVAYVGGGFGAGIHNTLEAAVWGIPVFFGPKWQKFREAHELQDMGAGFSVNNETEMIAHFNVLSEPDALANVQLRLNAYFELQKDAATLTVKALLEN